MTNEPEFVIRHWQCSLQPALKAREGLLASGAERMAHLIACRDPLIE